MYERKLMKKEVIKLKEQKMGYMGAKGNRDLLFRIIIAVMKHHEG